MRKVKFTREEQGTYRFELFENGACTERKDGRSLGWCILCEDVEVDECGSTNRVGPPRSSAGVAGSARLERARYIA